MEILKTENLSFTYSGKDKSVIKNINLSVKEGEFVTLIGKSGCGKTTLLRLFKPSLAPFGNKEGSILFYGKNITELAEREIAEKIGFVMQNPDNQIVTDKVWHELAFGLESLGYKTSEIRTRVSEMASFFGIENWFYKNVAELSGGQKQLLNLASVMLMQPEVLILDEPTSQLDPIAAAEFLKTLKKINDELGTTIILTEHRLEEVFAISDKILLMDEGEITICDTPKNAGLEIVKINHDMYDALPVPMRVFAELLENELPITIKEGKKQLIEYAKTNELKKIEDDEKAFSDNIAIEVKDAYFKYEKDLPYVIKNLNLTVHKGEFFAILGGNATGKTTALSLISGINSPQRGEIKINGEKLLKDTSLYQGLLGVLPQNPQSLFANKTVFLDLYDMTDKKEPKEKREKEVLNIAQLCRIEKLLESHPYDLSGGEQQRTALAMVLLKKPEILILDEPTKGMDAHFKKLFADILYSLKASGVTILMVSHDIEFCAEFADRVALFFDGQITSQGIPRSFFSGNSFYTTSANKMARKVLPDAILAEDIIKSAGYKPKEHKKQDSFCYEIKCNHPDTEKTKAKLSKKRIFGGLFFLLCFLASCIFQTATLISFKGSNYVFQGLTIFFAFVTAICFFPQKEIGVIQPKASKHNKKLSKRTILGAVFILFAIPFTLYFGVRYLGARKYYFISLLIILETLIPFFMAFENRKPKAREIVVISVLCAIAVAGRTAFFWLPQFKPVIALVIISGICFGGEAGFLVGAITGFVSNFFFGHGPWTPWQMFAMGIIGFFAGILFKKGFLRRTRFSLSLFGFLTTLVIYGGIMNPASVIMMTDTPTLKMIIASCAVGFPVDLIHALSTIFFLWFFSEPMIEKLERIKIKYGLLD